MVMKDDFDSSGKNGSSDGSLTLEDEPLVANSESHLAGSDGSRRNGERISEGWPIISQRGREQEDVEWGRFDDAQRRCVCTIERLKKLLEVLVVTSVYMTVGPALILVNRHILTAVGFKFPILLAALGQLASWLFTFIAFRVLGTHKLTMAKMITWRFYLTNMAVVGAASAGALAFGQSVYLYLSVSFVQILKSVTPVITLVLLVLFNIEHPSRNVWGCVLMISLGAAIASWGELAFNAYGTAQMLMGCLCEATRLVLTQKLLVSLKFSAMEGLYYNSPITAVWMLLASCVLELPRMHAESWPVAGLTGAADVDMHLPATPLTLVAANRWTFVAAAVLGVGVNVSTMLMIKYTGSVSLKLLATARNAGLVMYAVLLGGEGTTVTQVFGYAFSLVFFVLYVLEKAQSQ